MGESSHFSSALLGKLLKKTAREMGYQEFARDIPPMDKTPLPELGKEIAYRIWKDLKQTANRLMLEQLEILSTLTFSLVDVEKSQAWVLMAGDGFLAAEGKIIEIDQDNRPNYMAYHLSKDFEKWFKDEVHQFTYDDVQNLTLASDGVGSFEKLEKSRPDFDKEVEDYLLLDGEFSELKKPFDKKIELLKMNYGFIGTDDISIVQMKW